MKKTFGIILILIGIFGSIGLFLSSSPILGQGLGYLLGKLSPILFLIIGIRLVSKKKVADGDKIETSKETNNENVIEE